MSEDEHWKRIARRIIPERDGREVKRDRMATDLDWDAWTQREKEVYAAAFMFPNPEIELINHFHVKGVELNMKRYARTARIVDPDGNVWLVVEGGRPEQL